MKTIDLVKRCTSPTSITPQGDDPAVLPRYDSRRISSDEFPEGYRSAIILLPLGEGLHPAPLPEQILDSQKSQAQASPHLAGASLFFLPSKQIVLLFLLIAPL
ncbi:unknown protein [Desulfotalea psychrophila LSv54]|uniref:Uncharacterized protein n=1 Tax=Desulfotalea psychrophila (strain LSv54 / DSM 12343) TaxID=177439 RepID=Q6ALL9_DESPS|nr:unknown protein [Desulfotalea psychrophila LSv54]